MSDEPLQGLRSVEQLFDAIPEAARYEFADDLGRLGRDVLALQRDRAPKASGALAAGLTSQLLVDDKLARLRVGMLGVPAQSASARRRAAKAGGGDPRNLGDIYYGRFVEFGRVAQRVLRKRRILAGKTTPENLKRRIRDLVGQAKSMMVAAMAPRPFVNVPDGAVDTLVDQRFADFFDRVAKRAEAAA